MSRAALGPALVFDATVHLHIIRGSIGPPESTH